MSRSCAGTVFNQQNKDTVGYATELLVKDRNFRDPVTSSDEKVFQVSYDGKARVFGPPHSRFRHVGLAMCNCLHLLSCDFRFFWYSPLPGWTQQFLSVPFALPAWSKSLEKRLHSFLRGFPLMVPSTILQPHDDGAVVRSHI
ncbi:hypothetical protein HUJ05_005223 [Dendroctonus ponderosae]|nr:hypothetical protein HUJ05_005222 [Dendroctonus ponderosae]KAH1004407.1 hypothetical protein HUJ05_005223 [Dendroctonus ponderosae]